MNGEDRLLRAVGLLDAERGSEEPLIRFKARTLLNGGRDSKFTLKGPYNMMWGMLTACAWFVMAFGIGVLVLVVHDLLTPKYSTMKELQAGNVAAGLAAAGKMVGLGVVQAAAIAHAGGLWMALAWGAFGGVLMILGYLLFEAATFKLDVEQQLAEGNRAVGVLSFGISVGTGLVIAACIAAPASMGIALGVGN